VAAALTVLALVPNPAAANPALTDQAARWLSSQLKVPTDRITVQAPDPRWQMPACPSGLRFDTPFSNANTIRVRCEAPQWQVFLRAQWPEDALPATPVVAASPARIDPSPASVAARAPAEPRRGVVLTRAMSRGSLLSPASVQATQVPAREADSLLITDAQHLEQMEAVRDLPAGVPLRQTDIRPAVLVRQGQWVTMTVGQGTGFTITVRLEALQDGRLGERVMLRNAESGRTISGVVTGMNAAKGA
jgi:flagella basal body P-ring formation protein FlgA